ncbi:hypothetical protein JK359_20225 [Streptomyces actinomycinicus]|uniref:Uncharacterized protein n=1 Tax=Streptomyces actinomycinicus TaxID=1695166 RepID=A0A937JN65_9ACTN|nr:hypothetical protein [Streptomyces actinomycinicus]MBL1084265.1 hypothetical protein [Streptomyces actinomycinicus]
MTSFVLPHEVHGDGTHELFAVHAWFAGRSVCAAVPPDLGRVSFSYVPAGRRGYGEARDAPGSSTTAATDAADAADAAVQPGEARAAHGSEPA